MSRLLFAATPAFIIVACIYGAFLFLPGGALAMGCAGQYVWASLYGAETCHGRPPGLGPGTCHTAASIPFDGTQLLVAHKSLPFGTKLKISYHGRSLVLEVLDRGPYIAGRTLDLSAAAARYLGTISVGVATVCMERMG